MWEVGTSLGSVTEIQGAALRSFQNINQRHWLPHNNQLFYPRFKVHESNRVLEYHCPGFNAVKAALGRNRPECYDASCGNVVFSTKPTANNLWPLQLF